MQASAASPGGAGREPEPAAASANLPAQRRGGVRAAGRWRGARALSEGAPSRAVCSLRDRAECRLACAVSSQSLLSDSSILASPRAHAHAGAHTGAQHQPAGVGGLIGEPASRAGLAVL